MRRKGREEKGIRVERRTSSDYGVVSTGSDMRNGACVVLLAEYHQLRRRVRQGIAQSKLPKPPVPPRVHLAITCEGHRVCRASGSLANDHAVKRLHQPRCPLNKTVIPDT